MNKKILAAAIASAVAVPMSAHAIKFSLSGHVARTIRYVDTGDVSDIQFLDDTSSRTRLTVRGSEDIGNGMKAGVFIEFGVVSNRSDLLDVKAGDGGDTFGTDIRHSALWFGGNWGTAWLGHTSSASDGKMTRDWYDGMSNEQEHHADDVAAVTFRRGTALTALTVGDVFHTTDGGRRDVLRYDTPKFGPAQLSVAVGNNEFWDAGLDLDGAFSGVTYMLGVGYSDNGNNTCFGTTFATAMGMPTSTTRGCERFGLSGGLKFSQGTALTGAWGMTDSNDLGAGQDLEGDHWFVKLGHAFGNNTVSISYQESEQEARPSAAAATRETDATTYGIGFTHEIKKAGIEVYANYHRYTLDLNTAARTAIGVTGDPDDIDKVMVGARVKFN